MENSISKEEIEELPLSQFAGLITIVENPLDVPGIVEKLMKERYLGFDTETKPAFKKGESHQVSLLQISSANEAFLFRIHKTGLPVSLTRLLESKSVLKIGVGLRDDLRGLNKIAKFKPGGFVELQDMVKAFGIDVFSLKGLAALVLNVRISKRQRLSNWEVEPLTQAQIDYAATDAWVALRIFTELMLLEPAHEVKSLLYTN
jgi:ribonuclease D